MADGRHFENQYIAISQRKIIRLVKKHPIFMKFCIQQQILNRMNVTWSKIKKLHWTDSEFDRTYFLYEHNVVNFLWTYFIFASVFLLDLRYNVHSGPKNWTFLKGCNSTYMTVQHQSYSNKNSLIQYADHLSVSLSSYTRLTTFEKDSALFSWPILYNQYTL